MVFIDDVWFHSRLPLCLLTDPVRCCRSWLLLITPLSCTLSTSACAESSSGEGRFFLWYVLRAHQDHASQVTEIPTCVISATQSNNVAVVRPHADHVYEMLPGGIIRPDEIRLHKTLEKCAAEDVVLGDAGSCASSTIVEDSTKVTSDAGSAKGKDAAVDDWRDIMIAEDVLPASPRAASASPSVQPEETLSASSCESFYVLGVAPRTDATRRAPRSAEHVLSPGALLAGLLGRSVAV